MMILLLSLLSTLVLANPFEPFLVEDRRAEAPFFPQQAPYEYPFVVSKNLPRTKLALPLVVEAFGEDALSGLRDLYKQIPYDPILSLYNYPFPIRPEGEFLPYPFVSTLEGTAPTKWIPAFKTVPAIGEGVRSLAFQQRLNELTKSRAYAGNTLTLLKTPKSIDELTRRLSAAQDHVFLSTFLFQCDIGTKPLVDLMEKKIQAGVEVFVIIDRLMSNADSTCLKKLKSIGARVSLRGGLNHIFHEKMFVVDGTFAIVDGQNILAPQVLSSGVNNLLNDNAVGAQGPIVAQVARRFMDHWQSAKGTALPERIKDRYASLQLKAQAFSDDESLEKGLADGRGVCRLVTKGYSRKHNEISQLHAETLKMTKHYLFFNYIELTYKNPNGKSMGEKFLTAVLKKANAHPNLRVDMLTNNWKMPTDVVVPGNDYQGRNLFSKLVIGVSEKLFGRQDRHIPVTRANLSEQLQGGDFHWWSYAQYMHAKTMMSDNIWTLIGSYNINTTSENASYEQVLACVDTGLAQEMQSSIVVDALNSIPMPLDESK